MFVISAEAVFGTTAAMTVGGLLGGTLTGALTWLHVSRCRGEPEPAPFEAGFAALRTLSAAAAPLRAGLTEESARAALRRLRPLLGVPAVAMTDTERLLAWDGAGGAHAGSVLCSVRPVLSAGRPRVTARTPAGCPDPGCPVRVVVIAPLTVEGRVVGALVACGDDPSTRRRRALGAVARWLSGHLELAELDGCRARLEEAEMRALRAQISPHFVYNSLTTIASFVRTDPERARELLLDFADFARYAFREPRDFTTLAEELRSIDRYLLLERARFGDERLRFSVEVAPEVLPVAVPFLSLQPLIENAIRHGMEQRADGLHIRITARDAGDEAAISVEDDGAGMDPERLRALLAAGGEGESRRGVGLVNVDHRLRQMYGDESRLVIETAVGAGMKVSFRIPKSQTGFAVR